MSDTSQQKKSIYSISDIYPIFVYMHDQVGLSSDRFKAQNEIAATIWLAMRIDGEIKNGGIEQLFSNLGEHFDPACFTQVLKNIGSENGLALVKEFIDFIYQSDKHKTSFYGEYAYVSGFDKKLKKLHDALSDQYYALDPSVEGLIIQYAEANWDNPEFQEAIKSVVFESEEKDESKLIGNLNDALKNGNVATTKKILKNLSSVNQACEYGFVPILELPYVPNAAKRIELCQLLLDHGADIHMRDQYHNTVLHKAAGANGNESFIEFLLDNGADIEIKDDFDNTPIFETDTNPENASLLISRGANLHLKNRNGFTPLTKILSNYNGWYGNQHAKNYHPKIKKVMDLFLTAGATFQSDGLIHENTELSLFAEDPKILQHLLKQKTVKTAPEFDPGFGKWSAVFEASMKGNLESLQLLAKNGVCMNQALEVPHYETKTFVGATSFNVALNDEVRNYLTTLNVTSGSRKAHVLFLETRGNDEESVVKLIGSYKNTDEKEARALWNTVKKQLDESYERIDGKYFIYKPLFLLQSENEAEIKQLESDLKQFNCVCTLI